MRHRHFGLGKIVDVEGRRIRIRFLEGDRGEKTLAADSLADAMERHVLASGWRCEGPDGECVIQSVSSATGTNPHQYMVRYADGSSERLSEVELTPREDGAPRGALQLLLNHDIHALAEFVARESLVEALARLNQSGGGLRALLSSRIDLRSHQAYVAGIVLQAQRRRYILADEVGLGKTIEAGIILHDLLSQKPGARVLVVCPGALCYQWLSEMYSKFGGQTFQVMDLHDPKTLAATPPRAAIVSTGRLLKDMTPVVMNISWDMVVVDEAHHLLDSDTLYGTVRELALKTPSLLLLSALPAQRREDELLRLLSLLEPRQYEQGPIRERFKELYDAQPTIGRGLRLLERRINGLAEGHFSSADVVTAARNLLRVDVLRADPQLVSQVEALAGQSEGLAEVARHFSHHVADRYRVNRRILRNRRQHLLDQQSIEPIERKLRITHYTPDPLELEAISAVVMLLRSAQANGLEEAFLLPLARVALHATLSPTSLKGLLEELENAPAQKGLKQRGRDVILHGHLAGSTDWGFFLELLCLAVRDALDPKALQYAVRRVDAWRRSAARPRMKALCELLTRIRSDAQRPPKVLIFAGYPGASEEIAAYLCAAFGGNAVAEFSADMDRDDKEANVLRFRTKDATWILVSDETGGEGRNFQFASELIHVDTPWHVARVEQRIGRLDRLGRERFHSEVLSHVLCAEGTLEGELVRCFDEGLRVYHTSLSGLEFALREVEVLLARAVLAEEGAEDLRSLAPRLREIAEQERLQDEGEAVLDEASFERLAAERYRKVQQPPEQELALERAFLDYFRVLSPGSARQLSEPDVPSGALWRLSGEQLPHAQSMAKQMGNDVMASYDGTFRREVAQQRPSSSFFTVGHPLFESLVASLDTQGRGRTYAVECEIPGHESWMGLEFVFRAVPDLAGLENEPWLAGQARGLFSQRPVHVFVHENGRVEKEPDRLLQVRTACGVQTKDRMWWNLTKEKARVLQEVFPRGWAIVLPELNTQAEAHARETLARRIEPLVDVELKRLEELARGLRNDPGAEQGQEEAVHRLINAVRGWKVVLDAAGFLAINSSVLRDR
ncbi:SNF2-related protein [Archangium lansingense]|uniref:SNF2-related protein n=1 Tax=Archangium lansingense TaxID=2995310 RepID=A0ABT4ADY1_9BACT|nr:SNF2-related protein [Archangium lansinium]MCY1079134.1 SNF2-related protein [Archangium lansinium]